MIRRINIMGGPGSGKSTLAAWLFAELKMNGINVEHAAEFVKAWSFIGRPPQSFDQIYLFGKQMHKEDIVLRSDPNVIIVSESPVLLSCCYAKTYGALGWQHLISLSKDFDNVFPAKNFFISRGDCPYKEEGRFQDYTKAIEMDECIKNTLIETKTAFEMVKYDENHLLLEKCLRLLED